MRSFGALPILLLGGLLASTASSRSLPVTRALPPHSLECMHVSLDEWADPSHAAFRTGCETLLNSLYAVSKNNSVTRFVDPILRDTSGARVLPQSESAETCTLRVNSVFPTQGFNEEVTSLEVFQAAYDLFMTCVSPNYAPQGTFGGTQYFHNDSLSLTFIYTPTPVTDATVSLPFRKHGSSAWDVSNGAN